MKNAHAVAAHNLVDLGKLYLELSTAFLECFAKEAAPNSCWQPLHERCCNKTCNSPFALVSGQKLFLRTRALASDAVAMENVRKQVPTFGIALGPQQSKGNFELPGIFLRVEGGQHTFEKSAPVLLWYFVEQCLQIVLQSVYDCVHCLSPKNVPDMATKLIQQHISLSVNSFVILQTMGRRFKIRFSFLWYDFWIGAFYDRTSKVLYICPLPMCVIKIWQE
jgi:hypothetical protein